MQGIVLSCMLAPLLMQMSQRSKQLWRKTRRMQSQFEAPVQKARCLRLRFKGNDPIFTRGLGTAIDRTQGRANRRSIVTQDFSSDPYADLMTDGALRGQRRRES